MRTDGPKELIESGPFEKLDALDGEAVTKVVKKYKVDTLYHLAALLSATSEAKPALAW